AGGRSRRAGRTTRPAGLPASRNQATLAAAALLTEESGAVTRNGVALALASDPTAIRLCIEWLLPPCRERSVKFTLPPTGASATSLPRCRRSPQHSPATISRQARRQRSAGVVETLLGRSQQPTSRRG